MKNEKWLIALAAGIGLGVVIYKLVSKNIPDGAAAVEPFDINRYLGKWYEIARLPSRIEKNITNLTEDYSRVNDDTFKVITKGYNTKKDEWIEMSGKIKFAGKNGVGMFKLSYLGPFYAAYNVLEIDSRYKYALVSGSGLDYLWILSRETTIPEDVKHQFLLRAMDIGFAVEQLEWMDPIS
ncbi:lipocalin family protein [Mucilaginibacter sp. L196]|uniref:lipocalin family protein n=1 Tax=Mucilaginibacter sp. L196 TaxID=1641870 RepID=UPI00131E70DC|nr:lipocalin family protein [Mucilaginibacter sp. L196]